MIIIDWKASRQGKKLDRMFTEKENFEGEWSWNGQNME